MRQCPFYGCQRSILPTCFACRAHFRSLTDWEQERLFAARESFTQGRIGLQELRNVEQSILGERGHARRNEKR